MLFQTRKITAAAITNEFEIPSIFQRQNCFHSIFPEQNAAMARRGVHTTNFVFACQLYIRYLCCIINHGPSLYGKEDYSSDCAPISRLDSRCMMMTLNYSDTAY